MGVVILLLQLGCPLGFTSSFPSIQKLHPTSSYFPPHHNNILTTATGGGHKICLKKNACVVAESKSRRLTLCSALPTDEKEFQSDAAVVRDRSVSVVLLAGGKGKRMGATMPKQYLPLFGQPIALYSFHTFSAMVQVKEIIVVCDPSYKDIFEDAKGNHQAELKFALPGKERQDSVYNGLQECAVLFFGKVFMAVDPSSELVCVHDSARPSVLQEDVKKI